MMTRNLQLLYKIIMMLTLAMVVSCGTNGVQGESTGGITAKLDWTPSEKTTDKTVALAPVGVTTVRIIISAVGMTTVQKDFTAASGSGTIDGILSGTGRSLTVQGLNGSGTVIFQGTAANLTVQAGQTTNAGTIIMAATPTVTGISPTSGWTGTIINITGSNFSTTPANNTVKFNGTPATVTSASATSLTVAVPSAATTGPVSVETTGGTAVSAVSFTVPAPTITGISPPSGIPGSTVNISGSNFIATAANNTVKFNGTLATVTAATATSLTVAVPSGATTGPVSVMTIGGTVASTVNFTVEALPTTGQVAIWTRISGGVYLDNSNVGGINRTNTPPSTCSGGSNIIVRTLDVGTHSILGFGYDYTYIKDNFTITAGGCLVYELIGTAVATPVCHPGGAIACQPVPVPVSVPVPVPTPTPIPTSAYSYVGIATPATHKYSSTDICTSWQVIGAPVKFSTCSYSSGGSGYVFVENDSSSVADVCWSTSFNNGGSATTGCYTSMPSGGTDSPSCYSCGSNNGGAKMIELTKFNPK